MADKTKQYYSPPPYDEDEQQLASGELQLAPVTSQIVYTTTTTPVMAMPVGPTSTKMTCPSCRSSISTRVQKASTSTTHCCAFFLCLFLMWPCMCLPYCCDCFKNTNHYCPNCGNYLGTYNS